MVQLQDLPIELFLDVIEYATRGRTFAEVAYLRTLNGRFRDRITELYIRHERLLDMKVSSANCSTWPTYGNIHHFPLEIAVDLIKYWWRDGSVVCRRFTQCVDLIEKRMCILFPVLSQEHVHTTFCELFVRQSQIHRQRNHETDHILHRHAKSPATVRTTFLDFTRQAFYITREGRRSRRVYRESTDETERIHALSLEDVQAISEMPLGPDDSSSSIELLDSTVMIAAFALGLVDSRNEPLLQANPDSKNFISALPVIGCSALVLSATMGHEQGVHHMLQSLSMTDSGTAAQVNIAFLDAALNGHHLVLDVILKDDRAPGILSSAPHIGLFQSCFAGSEQCLQLLLFSRDPYSNEPSSAQQSVNQRRWDRSSVYRNDDERLLTKELTKACTSGTTSAIVGRLVISGAQVNGWEASRMRVPSIGVPSWPKTAISLATRHGHRHLVRKLVRQGAKISYPELLIHATEGGMLPHDDLDMLKTLHEIGVDVAAPGAMVLPQAARQGAQRIVEWLLDNFPDKAWANKAGLVLDNAVLGHDAGMVQLILNRGESRIREHDLDTAVATAVHKDRIECLVALIRWGAKFKQEIKMLEAVKLLSRGGKAEFVHLLQQRHDNDQEEIR